jgi:hypothetical protein
MNINDLSEMTTILLAISLASERVVTILKTTFPVWLADEKKTEAQEVDLVADKNRRLMILFISFLTSWFAASFLADVPGLVNQELFGAEGSTFLGYIKFGDTQLPTFILGLLASGGSSLWSNVLGYTKAVKDVQTQRKASEGLEYRQTASEHGLTTFDSGKAVRRPLDKSVVDNLSTLAAPSFDLAKSRI